MKGSLRDGADVVVVVVVVILDTDVVEDGWDSPEAIIGVHVSNFMRLYVLTIKPLTYYKTVGYLQNR